MMFSALPLCPYPIPGASRYSYPGVPTALPSANKCTHRHHYIIIIDTFHETSSGISSVITKDLIWHRVVARNKSFLMARVRRTRPIVAGLLYCLLYCALKRTLARHVKRVLRLALLTNDNHGRFIMIHFTLLSIYNF